LILYIKNEEKAKKQMKRYIIMNRVCYPLLLLMYIPLVYYFTCTKAIECKTVFQPGFEMETNAYKMVVYKHTITYCNHSFTEDVFTFPDAVLGVGMRNDWIRNYPRKTFYKSVWGFHREGGLFFLYTTIGFIFLIIFSVHILFLEVHRLARQLAINLKIHKTIHF